MHSETPIQRGKAQESIQKPATAQRIAGSVRPVAAGISAVSRFHTYPYQRGSEVGGGEGVCGLLNGTEGSAMIKGNLRWVTQLYRSPRADLKFLIFRLWAVKHPPASLAFESPMRVASSGA